MGARSVRPTGDGPGGIFLMDPDTFELKGQWEQDRGPQQLAYDFWWHLGHDTMITSEWGTPNMVKDGVNPELLLGGKYGHKLHVWDLDTRRHLQELDLGAEQQMVLELRPAHDPKKAYGFVGVVVSLKDLSSSIWMWYRENGGRARTASGRSARSSKSPPSRPTRTQLPPLLQGFKAVPPLVTRHQPVARRSLPLRLVLGNRRVHPVRRLRSRQPEEDRLAAPRRHRAPRGASEEARSSRSTAARRWSRSAATASASTSPTRSTRPWDEQFYPDGVKSWMVKIDADPKGGMTLDEKFFVEFDGLRAHQVRLEGGDASSDSYCYSDAQ